MSNINDNKLGPKLRFPEFVNDGKWEEKVLEKISRKIMVGIASAATHAYRKSGIMLFRNQNIKEGYLDDSDVIFIDEEYEKEHKNKRLKAGDLLTARTGYPGTTCVVPAKYEGSQSFTTLIIRPNTKIIGSTFLCYYINSGTGQAFFNSTKIGGGQKNVNASSLSEMPIPCPSEKEQKKIASCLSSLDEVITAESQKLEVLKDHKKGLLQNLLPQDGEAMPKLRFKEFDKDGEWEEKRLDDVSENVMYGMNAAAIEFDGKNKYIRITDIDENTRLFSPNPLTSPEGKIDEKYLVKIGDILFARTGASTGKSYFHQKENGKIYFAGFLIRFSIKGADPYFVYLQTLTAQYLKWVSATSIRSGQPGINAEEYKSYPFLIPTDPKEQQKIADTLSSLDTLINTQSQKVEALKLHKKGLLQGLFPTINNE